MSKTVVKEDTEIKTEQTEDKPSPVLQFGEQENADVDENKPSLTLYSVGEENVGKDEDKPSLVLQSGEQENADDDKPTSVLQSLNQKNADDDADKVRQQLQSVEQENAFEVGNKNSPKLDTVGQENANKDEYKPSTELQSVEQANADEDEDKVSQQLQSAEQANADDDKHKPSPVLQSVEQENTHEDENRSMAELQSGEQENAENEEKISPVLVDHEYPDQDEDKPSPVLQSVEQGNAEEDEDKPSTVLQSEEQENAEEDEVKPSPVLRSEKQENVDKDDDKPSPVLHSVKQENADEVLDHKGVIEYYRALLESVAKINSELPLHNLNLCPDLFTKLLIEQEGELKANEDEKLKDEILLLSPEFSHVRHGVWLSLKNNVYCLRMDVEPVMQRTLVILTEKKLKEIEMQLYHLMNMGSMDKITRKVEKLRMDLLHEELHAIMKRKLSVLFERKMEEMMWHVWHTIDERLVTKSKESAGVPGHAIICQMGSWLMQTKALIHKPLLTLVGTSVREMERKMCNIVDAKLRLIVEGIRKNKERITAALRQAGISEELIAGQSRVSSKKASNDGKEEVCSVATVKMEEVGKRVDALEGPDENRVSPKLPELDTSSERPNHEEK